MGGGQHGIYARPNTYKETDKWLSLPVKIITTPIKGVRNRVRDGLQLGLAATQATANAYRRATAARPATKVASQQAYEYIPSAREPVMSRARIAAAEAAKAKVGGVNKSKVKKPIKKVVQKPLVQPAKKKVATTRSRK